MSAATDTVEESIQRVMNRFPGLSARDVEIWREVVRGGSNAQIAATLWVSEDTVKTYLKRLFAKLGGPPHRTALAMHGLRTKVFSLPAYTTEQMKRPLSALEVQIVQWVADGLTNEQIAELREGSPLTVKAHLARISKPLGTGNRTLIATRCYRAGLIT